MKIMEHIEIFIFTEIKSEKKKPETSAGDRQRASERGQWAKSTPLLSIIRIIIIIRIIRIIINIIIIIIETVVTTLFSFSRVAHCCVLSLGLAFPRAIPLPVLLTESGEAHAHALGEPQRGARKKKIHARTSFSCVRCL